MQRGWPNDLTVSDFAPPTHSSSSSHENIFDVGRMFFSVFSSYSLVKIHLRTCALLFTRRNNILFCLVPRSSVVTNLIDLWTQSVERQQPFRLLPSLSISFSRGISLVCHVCNRRARMSVQRKQHKRVHIVCA